MKCFAFLYYNVVTWQKEKSHLDTCINKIVSILAHFSICWDNNANKNKLKRIGIGDMKY